MTSIAIVGIGALFPKAANAGHYWANIKNGVDGIGAVPATHWKPEDYFDADPKRPDFTYAQRGGFLEPVEFNPLEWGLPPKDLEATDTSQLLGLVAAKMALDDAGVSFDKVDRSKVSVILGVTGTLELVVPLGARLGHPHWKRAMKDAGVDDDTAKDALERMSEAYVPWQENSFPGLLGNVVAGRIANKLDLHGTNCVVDAACASSLSAVHLAILELQTGKADVAVTGGVDTFNDIFMFMCFSKTPALSPTGDSKPFDENGDGTILGEGLGIVVLKRLEDAERDGDRVYAVIKGLGTSSDGKGNAIYAPSAEGQKRCLQDAYTRAGIDPRTVDLVEAHGTGTRVGDAVEAKALSEVFGASGESQTALGSVKSQIGHTKAAAGAASLIKVALSLYNKVLPPTLKVTKPVEPLAGDSPFYVNASMRPWLPRSGQPRRAGLSAFGFGGSNFHAVLEEHTPRKAEPDWDGSSEIIALSAADKAELGSLLSKVPSDWPELARFAEASRTHFQASHEYRLLLVASRGRTDLARLMHGAKVQLETAGDFWSTPDGAHFGRGTPGKLAVLFPGQGSQAVGMLRDLACLFPEMLDTLAAANNACGELRLSDFIYPPTRYHNDQKRDDDVKLRATNIAQPALGAVSFGAWLALANRFHIKADAFAGHSYGELPALAAAGVFGPAELFHLSKVRGELMAAPRDGDPGSMLAVLAPLPDIETVLKEKNLDLVIANRNAPSQAVLSGSTLEIEKAVDAFRAIDVRTIRLAVAAAFHSPLVSDAAKPFRETLEPVEFRDAQVPVYSNTIAEVYPNGGDAKDMLARQLASPVEFTNEIRAMARDGVRSFLEVGPGNTLTRLVEAIFSTENSPERYSAIAIDAAAGKKPGIGELATALAKLAAAGHAVHLPGWEAGSRCRPQPPAKGMTVALCGANYRAPQPVKPPRIAPTRISVPLETPMPNDPIAQALASTQATLAALAKLQEQTAHLHKQFLDSQSQAQNTLAQLVNQQAAMFGGTVAPPPTYSPTPAVIAPPAPRPVVPPPPPVVVAPVIVPSANGVKHLPTTGTAATLLAVVAEKTGYPVEMLDLGMSLDADLGIDSIKRVEILSALQEKLPDAPLVKPEHLGTLQTLQDVVNFLTSHGLPNPVVAPLSELASEVISTPEPGPGPSSSVMIAAPGMMNVAGVLLNVVAEKTGYPKEMLDLAMKLDEDLGIDSIKRVEILSALQEALPDAPVVKPEHLGTLRSLQDVVDFILAGLKTSGPATMKVPVAPVFANSDSDIKAIELLRRSDPPSSLLAPKTEQISKIRADIARPPSTPVVVPPEPRTTDAAAKLPTSDETAVERSIVQAVDVDTTSMRPRVPFPEGGEFWLIADDEPIAAEVLTLLGNLRFKATRHNWAGIATAKPPANLCGLILFAPARTPQGTPLNRLAFQWAQLVGPKLRATARTGAAGIVSIARLDGAFGLISLATNADPQSGGLAGLVKTVRHEWPELAVKAFDLNPALVSATTSCAAAIVEEILAAGPLEVGISPTHRCTLELARTVRRSAGNTVNFGRKDIILVTGGGRGVTAEAAVCLAQTYHSTLILTGRTPAPPAKDPSWAEGISDDAGLKAAAAVNLTDATPKSIAEAVSRVTAQREIRETLRRIEAAGAKAAYFPVNVSNGRAVADLLHQVKIKHGPVTGIVHGAGVLADRRLENLTAEQFDHVFNTKVDGARHLLDLLSGEDLKAVVLFGSTTGRFGRVGQCAYACANEVLNKIAQVEARKRPNARIVCINWGPWEGGMVTPALRKVFEGEGIGLIPMAEGAAFLVHELNAAGRSIEVVALGAHRAGASAVRPTSPGSHVVPAPTGNTQPPADLSLAFERTVDVASHPILRSHVLDGRAVLPMAVHMEWVAHAALHANPGLVFHGFNDFRITHGIMVEDGGSNHLRLLTGKPVKQGKDFTVHVELRGRRKDGREVIHSRGDVILTALLPKGPNADKPPSVQPYSHPLDEVYQYFLFHGPDLHGIESIDGAADNAFIGSAYPAPAPAEWFSGPLRSTWVADPLVLDTSFQMMILWSFAQHGAGSLPCFLGRYRQYRRSFPAGPVKVVIRVMRDNGTFARADIDYLDAEGVIIAQVQDYECVIDAGLNQAFRKNQLAGVARV